LDEKYPNHNAETILQPLSKNEINVYELLDSFIPFLMALKLSVKSIRIYLTAVRSYFAYYDIDVIPSKFRRRVKVPKAYREDEEPLDAKDIRKILLSCNNRRLKTYLLILARTKLYTPPTSQHIPIYLAATGSQSAKAAARFSDGLITFLKLNESSKVLDAFNDTAKKENKNLFI